MTGKVSVRSQNSEHTGAQFELSITIFRFSKLAYGKSNISEFRHSFLQNYIEQAACVFKQDIFLKYDCGSGPVWLFELREA